jgi:hypothetical protein
MRSRITDVRGRKKKKLRFRPTRADLKTLGSTRLLLMQTKVGNEISVNKRDKPSLTKDALSAHAGASIRE